MIEYGEIRSIKYVTGELETEFDFLAPYINKQNSNEIKEKIRNELDYIDGQLAIQQQKIDELNIEINRLTNNADELDYAIAVISGTIAGMIDALFVGETEIDKDKIQNMLEKKYHTANDSAYRHKDKNERGISSPMYHRLDDLAHHPTLAGLVAAILVRYFRLVIFIDGSDGKPHVFFADTNNPKVIERERKQLQKAWVGAIVGGICLWFVNIAEKKYVNIHNEEMPKPLRDIVEIIGTTPILIEVLKAADIWIGHMMSDVSTSQGIPGVFLSFLKEISILPGLRNTKLPDYVSRQYNEGDGNLSEWGGVVFENAKKQALPIFINEVLVRGFYFVRHLVCEYENKKNWTKVDWSKTLPFGNRTIERMMTIATGTFVAIDVADASIRSAIKSGGINPAFFSNMILRVNIVGIGRFAIAVGTDIGMGIKKERTLKEKNELLNEWIRLMDIKIYYREADVMCSYVDMYESETEMHNVESNLWKEVKNVHEAFGGLESAIIETCKFYVESNERIATRCEEIVELLPGIEKNNPGLLEELFRRY